ncbi:MAG: hypothetical protein HFH12_03620 [Dorea sp.]|nr:hypothetical protein [Dorea sp.]
MNYENFYLDMQPHEKSIKDGIASLQKVSRAVHKELESGDMKNMAKDLDSMAETAASLSFALKSAADTVKSFDTKLYFENGDFAGQILSICQEKGIDVRGEFPVYEMFPYRVRLDVENQDIYLDRKKVPCIRPASFVETIVKGQEKLNKASFNALTFAGELASAYDLAILKFQKQPGSDIYLASLYKYLAPMGRFRKEYDQQSFAFDLARLYVSGEESTKNGRRFQFGPSRDNKKAYRILDKDGKEQYLATICFFNEEVDQ